MKEKPLTLSVPEAAREYFGIKSKDGAYAAAHAGAIPFIRVGKKLMRVPRAAMEKLVNGEKHSAT
jgi:excisionase family DNA binding protein